MSKSLAKLWLNGTLSSVGKYVGIGLQCVHSTSQITANYDLVGYVVIKRQNSLVFKQKTTLQQWFKIHVEILLR